MTSKPGWMKAHGRPWQRGGDRVLYDNPWIRVREFEAQAPTGAKAPYGLVEMKNYAIAVLPLHDDGTVTLVGQNRFPLGYSWEIPEGGGALDIDPMESGRRELREEAGLLAADWRLILRMQMSNSVTDERAFGYLATALSQTRTEPDPTEDFAIVRAPFQEVLTAATEGHIEDALTVAMLLRTYHMATRGELSDQLARLVLG
jgi:8-oxo-dGTP pyrophosphatase MutT (NUDIX family)